MQQVPKGFQHTHITGTFNMKDLASMVGGYVCVHTRFVQKVSGLTTVHEVDKGYGVLTPTVFNIVPFRSYTLRPTFLPLLETFCELLFQDV